LKFKGEHFILFLVQLQAKLHRGISGDKLKIYSSLSKKKGKKNGVLRIIDVTLLFLKPLM